MKTDVVVIGAGIVGCASAYYLANKGLKVTVVEKEPCAGFHASGRNGGGVRQHGRKASLPLAMESVRLWATLPGELEADIEYQRTGNINIAMDEASAAVFEREITWEHAHGLKECRLLTVEECHRMVPGLQGPVVAGKFCPTDGIANPMLTSAAFARAARRSGVVFKFNTQVTSLLRQGKRVRGVAIQTGEIEADNVVNAAGAWAARFCDPSGCKMYIGPGRSQLLITERIPQHGIKLWVNVRGHGYMRPTASGNLALGSGGVRNDDYSNQVDLDRLSLQAERWAQFFPWLKDVKVVRAFAGITEYTPDGEPYIGAVPGEPGLFVAAAFHGEGFCPGPIVGKILAELITGVQSSVSLDAFRPDRFSSISGNGHGPIKITYPWEKMFYPPTGILAR